MKKQQNKKTKAKRKDVNGRVLGTGESQRADGRYEFRYSDGHDCRRSLYTLTLEELLQEYVDLKRNVRYATRRGYELVQGVVAKYPFAKQSIRSIKVTDAKRWIIQLHEDGYAWNSIVSTSSTW